MASGDDRLLAALRSYRLAFDEENPNLSTSERDKIFQERWNRISSHVMCNSTPASPSDTLVPQKRSAPVTPPFGLEPIPKRAVPASHTVSAPQLQRHISAPAGPQPTRSSKTTLVSETASHSHPINIPKQSRLSGRRASTSNASNPDKFFTPGALNNIDELHDMSPADYLAQASDQNVQPALTFSFTGPEPEHGEWHAPDMSMLATARFTDEGTHSPVAATSDSGLTTASTAFSEPMTRCNTNDQICESFGIFHMDSALGSYPSESIGVMPKVTYPPSLSVFPSSNLSQFPFSHMIPEYQTVSVSSAMMKPTPSQESVSSSSSESISFESPMFNSDGHPSQVKPRTLAPKKQDDASQQPPMPKLVAIKGEDGTIKHKAEIARAIRQPQQRKTTFCDFCNDQPQGFHGDHELRRHIERQHTQYRKVWICRDISEDGTFLRNCKACRNNKTYGANYNAAAHLRRTHFNPCKNKRGGRGKKSEGRGGMGGGNSPSMEELKKWMYETYEVNFNGRVIVQNIAPDANMPSIPMTDLTSFDQNVTVSDQFDFELDTPIVHDTQGYGNSFNNEFKHVPVNPPYQQLHPRQQSHPQSVDHFSPLQPMQGALQNVSQHYPPGGQM